MNKAPMHINSKSVLISATSSSSATDLGVVSSNYVIVQNTGSSMAFVSTGASGDTVAYPEAGTATAGTFIPPGAIVTMTKPTTDTHLLAICDTGNSTTLTAQAGAGI